MFSKKTLRSVKKQEITLHYLADYTDETNKARRRFVKNYHSPAITRLLRRKEERNAVSKYFRQRGDIADLVSTAHRLYG